MILLLFLFLVFYVLFIHFVNKIQNLPPTPFPALPIVGHLHFLNKPLHRSLSAISKRYGPILLLKFGFRRVLLVSSPSVAKECFTKNDIVFANRPRLLAGKYLGYNFTSLVWASYGDHWRNLRKLSSLEILSSHRLQLLSSIRSDEVHLLIRRLFRNKDEMVDLKSAFFELMQNVMMRMIAGKRYYAENVEEVEAAVRFREIVRDTFEMVNTSNMGDFFPLLAKVGGTKKRLLDLQTRRDEFIQGLIQEHRNRMTISPSEEENKTLIEVLLALQQSEPEYYTDQTIKSLMLVLLTGGTDTPAAAMEWAMSLLVNNPEILKKAQKEIDNVAGHDCLLTESDVLNIPYLQCIIREVLRMYPVGPLLVLESSEECSVGGYRVPLGTMLLVNVWSIHNDPQVWDEPQKFKPERFEGCEAGVRDGFQLMPFGLGRRSCPGEGLALRMIGLTLGLVLQCFEWERVGKEMVDMTEGVGLTMPKAQPLLVKCRPRPSMVNLLSQV